MHDFFHFDPINLGAMLVLAIAAWTTMRNTLTWHTKWIAKHSEECDEQRKTNSELLTELKATNAHLITLTEAQSHRLTRIEQQLDYRGRAR